MSEEKTVAQLFAEEVRKATLTGEGLEAFNALVDKVEVLEVNNRKLLTELETKTEQRDELSKERHTLQARVTGLAEERDLLRQKVDSMMEADTKRQVAEASRDAYKHSLEVVFKPAMVRRKVHNSRSTPVKDQYGCVTHEYTYDTEETEDNYE